MRLNLITREGLVTLLNVKMPTDYMDQDSCMLLGLIHNSIAQVTPTTPVFVVIGDFSANSVGLALRGARQIL